MKTLVAYLREQHERGIYDHALRVEVNRHGVVTFYIHADGKDSDTIDCCVSESCDGSSRCEVRTIDPDVKHTLKPLGQNDVPLLDEGDYHDLARAGKIVG